ncbi:PQQ-binding-like beta-propeller repeat protein [Paenibacillus chitinolyticus]|uniref:PQQ-binding-like beta-propeller repeat protein n=1 Tax=Paenibacillus chitinolyticus TaxID=79263 RepID=UPI001C49556D|nr:PQQ-binding-like beta-propeller repeat protein [Paenibacillus chitinolyticus]MBV6715302.1 PQQ-binding-like beta-propeller repeat protein [Paenibacillus chitinolyticus]
MKKGKTRRPLLVLMSLMMTIAGWSGAASAAEPVGAEAPAAALTSKLAQKTYGSPEELLIPNNYTVAVFNGAAGKEDGHNVLYATSKGKPGHLNVIDLDGYKLLRSIPIAPSESSWAHTVAPDGTLFLAADGGGARLWSYSPVTHTPVQVAQFDGQSVPNSITTDEQGRVYVGTYPGGKVYQYDPATKLTKDYGRVIGQLDSEYVRSIAYQGGNVYAGTAHKQIVRVNLQTGAKTDIAASLTVKNDTVYDLDTIDNRYLFARYTDGSGVPGEGYIYDTQTEAWLDIELQNVTGLHATDSQNGKLYYMSDKKLKTFDLATLAVEETGMEYGTGLRGADWVEFKNNPDLPGKTLVTVRYDGGVTYLNIDTKQVIQKPPVIPGLPGVVNRLAAVSQTQLITTGSQARSSLVNLTDNTAKPFSIGQADSVYPIGSKVYMGVYPEGSLFVYDLNKEPGDTNPAKLAVLENDQERLVNMTSGLGKLYISTISGYGTLGGSLTVYDPASGEIKVHRNVVQNQSVLSTTFHDGKIFGSTTIRGGLGSEPTEAEAKIFVWDAVKEQKITEFPLRVPGLDKPIFIGDLAAGPDGLIWGASYEYIFAIDPHTYEVVKSKRIYPQLNFTQWAHHPLRWSEDGLLYVLFNNKLTVIDPDTLEFRTLTDTSRFDLGMDGNLYFTDQATNTILYRMKVDGEVTEEPPGTPLPVRNAGFEDQVVNKVIPGWSPLFATGTDYFYEVSGDRSVSGAKSLKITDKLRTASVALQSDKITVQPGGDYEAGAQIYIESGQPGLLFRFFDADNATISTLETHLDESRLAQWQKVTLRGKAPANAAYARLIAVTSRYNIASAYYDDFFVQKKEAPVPSAAAALLPEANADGWLNRDALLRIQTAHASAVRYSAEGAQPSAEVTVNGTAAELSVAAEGVTTVTYSAISAAGIQSAPGKIAVRLDKTAPSVQFTAEPVYTVDRTIEIRCAASDALSGLAVDPCAQALMSAPAYSQEPGKHEISVTAADKAGNKETAVYTYEIAVTYVGMCSLVKQFAPDDRGTELALCATLTAARKAEEKGGSKAKEAVLLAFTKQVDAFSGRKLTPEEAGVLKKLAAFL